jgi:phosphoglycerate dehydrogenase-like enzyme
MYDDFTEVINGQHDVRMHDPSQPLKPQFQNKQVVVDQSGWGTHEMIDAALAGGAKLWQVIGTGLDHIDVAYCLSKGIPIAYSPGLFSGIALAEHALFFMLCLAKNVNASHKNVQTGRFYHPLNEELADKTLGLVGFGGSGKELAKRAYAFGMRVLAIDVVDVPKTVQEEFHVQFLGGPDNLGSLLKESDYVSIHAPLTSQTRHLMNYRAFELMKPGACLINVARGEIVDEAALLGALQSGKLSGAGLDVFAEEPLPVDHPFQRMDNVILSPHIAGGTRGTNRRRGRAAAENVLRVAQGLPPLYPAQVSE